MTCQTLKNLDNIDFRKPANHSGISHFRNFLNRIAYILWPTVDRGYFYMFGVTFINSQTADYPGL